MRRWLPSGFEPPVEATVPYGHRLRPELLPDAQRLCVAVPDLEVATAERLLRARVEEMRRRAAYTYALLDADETALLGEVRLAPGSRRAADAEVSWWIVPECCGTDLGTAVEELVPAWVDEAWPFGRPSVVGPVDPLLALGWGEC